MSDWALDEKNTKTLGSGGSKLLLGRATYRIVEVTRPLNSQDQSGQERQTVFELENEGDKYMLYLNTDSAKDSVSSIARSTVLGIYRACGFKDACKPDRLKKTAGKYVDIEAIDRPDKTKRNDDGSPVLYRNVKAVFPAEESSEEEEEQEEEPQAIDEPEAEEEVQEEKPAAKKAMPWKKK